MRVRGIVTALALVTTGCAASSALIAKLGTPVAATALTEPQLAMTRLRPATGHAHPMTDLILVTLPSKHDRVILDGAQRGWPEPAGPPAWSPDGREIAFTRIDSGPQRGPHGLPYDQTDIFIINADGRGLHQLTHTGDAANPVWSPDGQDIAFARQHIYVSIVKQTLGLTSTMWIIHPDGTGARQLTSAVTGQDDVPGSFSPDGHTLAFTRLLPSSPVAGPGPDPDKVELLSLTDGTITTLGTAAGAPAYSPDGKWIALVSPRDHNGTHPTGEDSSAYANELYLINLATHRWQRLTHTNGIDEEDPSFSPDGQRIAYLRVDAISTRNVSDNYHDTIYEINVTGSCPTRIRDDLADRFEYRSVAWRPGPSPHNSGPLHCPSAQRGG